MNGRGRSNKQKAARETQRCTCSVGSGLFSTAVEIVIRMFKENYKKGNYINIVISQKPTFYTGDLKNPCFFFFKPIIF